MTRERAQALELWLPPLAQFSADGPLRRLLSRADRLEHGVAGYLQRVTEQFAGFGPPLPAGALTRESIAHDAADALWLAADPAWARADINGVRLMACGHLQLDMTQAQALAAPLMELFAEADMQLLVSAPEHWHVRLPAGIDLPEFSTPEQAMGEDLSQHVPQDADGRRWRVLLNNAQVLLHQNPVNRTRLAQRLPPVNMLWLWGEGRLPEHVQTSVQAVITEDQVLGALTEQAGIPLLARNGANLALAGPGWLVDLQDLPAAEIDSRWWTALSPLFAGQTLLIRFAGGERWLHRPWHRWRMWRRDHR